MKKNIFWGIFWILAGVYLIISRMGYLQPVGVFTIIATIVCIAAFVYSIPHVSFGGMLFSLAFIGILYDEQLGITSITPWTILLAALLGTIGLNMLFSPIRSKRHHSHFFRSTGTGSQHEPCMDENGEDVEGENINLKSSFGALIRYVTSEDLRYVFLDTKCSGVKVYFDNARIPTGNATLEMNCSFSGVELYVPKNWEVINHLNSSFGGITEKNKPSGEAIAALTLEGENAFGGITVYYV